MTTPASLIRHLCAHYGVEESDVRGGSRFPRVVRVRRLAVYILRFDRALTFGEIARSLSITRGAAAKAYHLARRNPDRDVVIFLGGIQ